MEEPGNPRISGVLRAVTWLEVAILLWAGGGLLFHPPLVQGVWPWSLAPFNLRYLGALYLAALLAAFLQAWSGRWSPGRVVTTMIFVFTFVVTVFSFVHIERFDARHAETWIWFVLYIGVCANAVIHLWLYRAWAPAAAERPTGVPRAALAGLGVCLGGYGLALLAAPGAAAAFWPWKLDTFHAQLYSVTFLTPAAGMWVLLRGGTAAERGALGLTLAAWGILPIAGLVAVDGVVRRVQWGDAGTWLWCALFAVMFVVGAWIAARRGRPA